MELEEVRTELDAEIQSQVEEIWRLRRSDINDHEIPELMVEQGLDAPFTRLESLKDKWHKNMARLGLLVKLKQAYAIFRLPISLDLPSGAEKMTDPEDDTSDENNPADEKGPVFLPGKLGDNHFIIQAVAPFPVHIKKELLKGEQLTTDLYD